MNSNPTKRIKKGNKREESAKPKSGTSSPELDVADLDMPTTRNDTHIFTVPFAVSEQNRVSKKKSVTKSGNTTPKKKIKEDINGEGTNISDDEVEQMLDQNLPEHYTKKKELKRKSYDIKEKSVLLEKGITSFEELPSDWTVVSHRSGMPVYLHRASQVCTLSKPYSLRNRNFRDHDIPITAIPCLAYREAVKNEEIRENNSVQIATDTDSKDQTNEQLRTTKSEEENTNSAKKYKGSETQQLTAEGVNNYCKNLFKFKTVQYRRRRRWDDRGDCDKNLQSPTSPQPVSLPAQPKPRNKGEAKSREWITQKLMAGDITSVLQEYVKKLCDRPPFYLTSTKANRSPPVESTVHVNGKLYGLGRGFSKDAAKKEAARAALKRVVKEQRVNSDEKEQDVTSTIVEQNVSLFESVLVNDGRVAVYSTVALEPSPIDILRTCLCRTYSSENWDIDTNVIYLEDQTVEVKMKVGAHEATIVSDSKEKGEQLAAQAILQLLHPRIKYWGSLLCLYGSSTFMNYREAKLEERQETLTAEQEAFYAAREKLRESVRIQKERDEAHAKENKD